ncbi:MAG: hypothetical protein BGO77_06710 [Caedibacter sp. 37-49]|nr:MAG: hypothetical protein BGO77_06710 [Caedibacter sp. 37-49]
MLNFLRSLQRKSLILFEQTSHVFFETTLGQKVLILLAPFFLLPGEPVEESHSVLKMFKFLHMQTWAPILGGAFFASACTVLLRTLQHAHMPFLGSINVDTFNVLFLLTLGSVLFGYSMALSRFVTPYMINFFIKDEKLVTESFLFWTTRYGGFLMLYGLIVWIVVGLFALKPSFTILLIMLGVISTVGYAVRKELVQQRQRFILMISPRLRLSFLVIENIILIALSLLATLSLYHIWIQYH